MQPARHGREAVKGVGFGRPKGKSVQQRRTLEKFGWWKEAGFHFHGAAIVASTALNCRSEAF
jgi:hypothetical protein